MLLATRSKSLFSHRKAWMNNTTHSNQIAARRTMVGQMLMPFSQIIGWPSLVSHSAIFGQ
jgi:hypothetical protein